MEYQTPYPSSVPHIILVPSEFQLSNSYFFFSFSIECLFTLVSFIFLLMAIYFRFTNQKLLFDYSGSGGAKREKENIICQVLSKSDYLGKMDEISDEKQSNKSQTSVSSECSNIQTKNNSYRLLERRIIYYLTYTVAWIICISLFDFSLLSIISISLYFVLVVIFNLCRAVPSWKITLLLYIIPIFMSIGPYMDGYQPPYEWTTVQNAMT